MLLLTRGLTFAQGWGSAHMKFRTVSRILSDWLDFNTQERKEASLTESLLDTDTSERAARLCKILLDNQRVKWCITKHLFFWGSSATNKITKKTRKRSLRHTPTNFMFSRFTKNLGSSKTKRASDCFSAHLNFRIDSQINLELTCLRICCLSDKRSISGIGSCKEEYTGS